MGTDTIYRILASDMYDNEYYDMRLYDINECFTIANKYYNYFSYLFIGNIITLDEYIIVLDDRWSEIQNTQTNKWNTYPFAFRIEDQETPLKLPFNSPYKSLISMDLLNTKFDDELYKQNYNNNNWDFLP